MKKWLLLFPIFGLPALIHASPPVRSQPVYPCTTPFAVTLTTFSWTLVPTSQCGGRTLVVLNNPNSNAARIGGIVTTSAAAPATSTTTASMEISPGSNDRGYPISEEGYLWMISRNAGSTPDSIYGQEFKAR